MSEENTVDFAALSEELSARVTERESWRSVAQRLDRRSAVS